MDNNVKIDWYSFSFFVPFIVDEGERENAYRTAEIFDEMFPELSATIAEYGYEFGNGRRPYSLSIRSQGITLFCRPTTEWMLCEISGQGCKLLRERDALIPTIARSHERCTRVDLALDIFAGNENKVSEFINAGYSKAFKTKADIVSGTGSSHYIGSRTSMRMCRVYQYNPPHPRHKNMRIEFEIKKELAKKVAGGLIHNSVSDEFFMQARDYKFKSKLMPDEVSNKYVAMDTIVNKKPQNSTLLWIIKQVAPAFKRLVADGTIENPYSFIKKYFLD